MPIFANRHNENYLQTKQDKLNHFMSHITFNTKQEQEHEAGSERKRVLTGGGRQSL
jgi:hypothetical protein